MIDRRDEETDYLSRLEYRSLRLLLQVVLQGHQPQGQGQLQVEVEEPALLEVPHLQEQVVVRAVLLSGAQMVLLG